MDRAAVPFLWLIVSLTSCVHDPAVPALSRPWNGKRCAVVLTYDDAINSHLDTVIPALDSLGFHGTFYLVGSAKAFTKRITEWKAAAEEGHELGNHTIKHACDGSLRPPGSLPPDRDLVNYTVDQEVNEIRQMNAILTGVDGKTWRTFAYPCDDQHVQGVFFYDELKHDLLGARTTEAHLEPFDSMNFSRIGGFTVRDWSADQLIDVVRRAQASGTLAVFVFHHIDGPSPYNVSSEAHKALLLYLKERERDIWVATMEDVVNYVRAYRDEEFNVRGGGTPRVRRP